MPHAELKYSSDLNIDPVAVLRAVEETILALDPGSGACKGRAYPALHHHHSHLLISISLLPKPHRDADFMATLSTAIEACVKSHLKKQCYFTLALGFSGEGYVTNEFVPPA